MLNLLDEQGEFFRPLGRLSSASRFKERCMISCTEERHPEPPPARLLADNLSLIHLMRATAFEFKKLGETLRTYHRSRIHCVRGFCLRGEGCCCSTG